MATSKRTSLNKGDDPLTALFGTPVKPATPAPLSSASRASKPAPTPTQNRIAASSPHAPPIPSIPSNFALMLEYDERHRDAEQAALEAQNAMQSEQQHAVAAMTYSPHHSRPTSVPTQAQTMPAPTADSNGVPQVIKPTADTSASTTHHVATLPSPLPTAQYTHSQQPPITSNGINKYLSHDLHSRSDRVSEAQQAARVKQLLGHRRSKTAVKMQQQLNQAAGGPARTPHTIEESSSRADDAASFIHDSEDGLTPATSPHQQRNGVAAHQHSQSTPANSQLHLPSTDSQASALPSPISAEQAINQLKIDIDAAPQDTPSRLPWRRRSNIKVSKDLQRALADDWHIGSHGHLGGEKAAMAIDDVYLIQPPSTSYAAMAAASGSYHSSFNPNQPHERALPGQFYVSTYRLYFQPDASHLNDPTIQHAYPWPYCSGSITTNLHVPLACIERIEIVERPKSQQPRLRQVTSPDPQHRALLHRPSTFTTPAATPTPSAANSVQPTPSSARNQQPHIPTAHIATAHPPLMNQILEIHTRDGRIFRFGFFKPETCRKVFDGLALYAFPGKNEHLFAFNYKLHAALPAELNGWQLYDAVREYKRMNIPSTDYTLSTLNADYSLSITYPRILCTPSNKYMTDAELLEIAEFRSRGRLPVLVWKHPTGPQTIWRCSQPKVGVNNSRCQADEKLLYIVGQLNSECRTVTIFDARPKMNARANMLAGKGYENIDNYPNCKLVFLNIGNIHVMRESYQRLLRVVRSDVHDINYLQGLAASGWLQHISELIKGTVQMVLAVQRDKQSIVSHCSDGWDRTTQFVTLTELCLDPYYRTLTGFLVMIEKEWCSFGHQFYKRVGHMNRDPTNDDRSPIFLQWLDCVFQLQRQFPTHFEFNSLALVTIYDALNSCRFGTFLFNTEAERFKAEVHRRTVSLGTYMLASPAACAGAFLNPLYVPPDVQDDELEYSPGQYPSYAQGNENSSKFASPTAKSVPSSVLSLSGQVLYPSWSLKKLSLWADCYLRYVPEQCDHGIQADELLHDSATTVFTDSYSAALINQLQYTDSIDDELQDKDSNMQPAEQLYMSTAMVDGQRRYYSLPAHEQSVTVDITVSDEGHAELSVVASRAVRDEDVNPLRSPQSSPEPFHSPLTDVSSMPGEFEDALELRSPAVPLTD